MAFHTHYIVRIVFIVEDPIVTVKCRTAIKALFFHFNFYPSVMLNCQDPYSFLSQAVAPFQFV